MIARAGLAVWGARIALAVAVLTVLEVAVRTGRISALFVAAPSRVLDDLWSGVADGSLIRPLSITLYEAAVASAISMLVGTGLGYLLWRFDTWGRAYEPLLGGLFAAPVILLYPIALVLFGRTTTAVIALGLSLGVPAITLYSRRGFVGVRPVFLRVAATNRLSRWQAFRQVLLPAAAPMIFTGVRLGISGVLISVVGLEYLAQIGGLGRVIAESYLRFDVPRIYAAVAVVLVITATLMSLVGRLEQVAHR
jgi:NitT/TauT family transport system permease protein